MQLMTRSLATDGTAGQLPLAQAEAHPFCFVCSASNPMGLAVQYTAGAEGGVTARRRWRHGVANGLWPPGGMNQSAACQFPRVIDWLRVLTSIHKSNWPGLWVGDVET